MGKPTGDKHDLSLDDGYKAYHMAEEDLKWVGYRNGKVVAIFCEQEDANAWLLAVDGREATEPRPYKVEDARDVV